MALGLTFTVALAACSDEAQDQISGAVEDGGSDEGGSTEPPPETTAAPEQPAPEEPAPEEPAPAPEEDEFSDEDWIVIIALGLLVLLVIIVATSLATSHSEKKTAAKSSLDDRLRQIVGGGRWLHDQGSLEVLRLSDPDQIRSAWAGTRASTVDLEGQIAALRAGIDDPDLDGTLAVVGQRVTSLRGALDSYVSLRVDTDGASTALIENATQTVLERRKQLEAALEPLAVRR